MNIFFKGLLLSICIISHQYAPHAIAKSPSNTDENYDTACLKTPYKKCIQLAEKHLVDIKNFQGGKFLKKAVSIDASQIRCTAPCGIHFKAIIKGDFGTSRPFHDLAYHWNFDDPESSFQTLPKSYKLNRSANHAQGPYAAHVFSKGGIYNVLLRVSHPNGKTSHSSISIKVLDPEDVYSVLNTLCVSEKKDFQSCHPKAQHHSSLESAFKVVAKRGNRNRYRILLRAGETFNFNKSVFLRDTGPRYFGRYGQGANPKLNIKTNTTIFYIHDVAKFTFSEIDIEGDYDPVTGSGSTYSATAFFVRDSDNTTIYRVKSSGIGITYYFASGTAAVVADTSVTNWYDYASFNEQTEKLSYIGNVFAQNRKAVSGPGAKQRNTEPRWADHGPIRISSAEELIISQNLFFSNTGWSSNGEGHQPTIRYHTGGGTNPTKENHSGVINKNELEGGYTVLALHSQNGTTEQNLGNLIVERNVIIGTSNTINLIELEYGNTTVRNNIAIMPDLPDDGLLVPFSHFISYSQNRASSAANSSAPREIYGNTFLQLQSQPKKALKPLYTATGNEKILSQFANLIYSPNTSDNAYTRDPKLDSKFRPTAAFVNNPQKNEKLFETFYGNLRPQNMTTGAVER